MALNPLSSIITPRWIKAYLSEARRFVIAQPPAIRVLFAFVLVAGMGSIVYLAGQPFSPTLKPYLASGRSFSQDELLRVRKALEGRVAFTIDPQRRVQVTAEQFDAATALLLKLDLGVRSVDELRNELTVTNVFESESDKQRRERISQEKILESLIDAIPEVAWSYVKINQSKPTSGFRPVTKLSAFVQVEPRDDTKLSYRTVEAIQQILVKNVSDLAPDAVNVMDRKGRTYLAADNPLLHISSRNHAREEQIRQEILEKLDWIKGVRVSVHVPTPTQEAARPAAVPAPMPKQSPTADEPRWARKDGKGTRPAKEGARPQVAVAPNEPLDPDAFPIEAEERVAVVEPASLQKPLASTPAIAKAEPREQGKVGVEVPRSFYYLNYMIASGEQDPSAEAIKPSMSQIENKIRESVKLLLPGSSDGWEIRVDMIPDEIPLVRNNAAVPTPKMRNQVLGWEVMGASVAIVVAASFMVIIRYGRRSEVSTTTTSGGRRFHRDSPSEPAPSERVRELVRRNPQAAASVLQRWVGQGREVT